MSPQLWPPRPPRIAHGTAPGVTSAGLAVTFPSGTFTAPPTVVATAVGSHQASPVFGITAAGFSVAVSSGPDAVNWIAIQI